MVVLHGRAGRLTAENGGFRPGQSEGCYGVTIGGNAWDPNSWPFNGQMDEVCRRPPCAPGRSFLVSLCAPPPGGVLEHCAVGRGRADPVQRRGGPRHVAVRTAKPAAQAERRRMPAGPGTCLLPCHEVSTSYL